MECKLKVTWESPGNQKINKLYIIEGFDDNSCSILASALIQGVTKNKNWIPVQIKLN